VAPSPCACTAFRVASLSDTLGACCWLPRARRSPPAVGAVLAGRPLRRLSVVLAFPPNRVNTRSATSSSLSWSASFVRSASSRASRSEIRCFSCPISSTVAICSLFLLVSPIPTNIRLRRYSRINGESVHRKKIGCKKLLPFDGPCYGRAVLRYRATPPSRGKQPGAVYYESAPAQADHITADSLRRQFEHRAQAIDSISSLLPMLSP
jgi:hypothetical protein